MKHENSFNWVRNSLLAVLIVVLIVSIFSPVGQYSTSPLLQYCGLVFILVIGWLLADMIYQATQYRSFDMLFADLLLLNKHEYTTDSERDSIINRLVGLSNRRWNKFLMFCRKEHEFMFSTLDKNVISDIEMLRALED